MGTLEPDTVIYFEHKFEDSPGWILTVALTSVVMTVQAASAIYIFANRKFPPIRAKQVPPIMGIAISAACFYIGELHTQGIIPSQGPFLNSCIFWSVWMMNAFGILLHSSCYVFRLFRLYVVLVVMHSKLATSAVFTKARIYTLGFAVIYAPVLLIAITVSALPDDKGVGMVSHAYSDGSSAPICEKYVLGMGLIIGTVTYHSVLHSTLFLKVRKIRNSFNEFDSLLGLFASIGSALVYVILLYSTPVDSQGKTWYLCVRILLVTAGLNLYYWSICYKLVVGKLLRPEETLKEFTDGMAMTHMSQVQMHQLRRRPSTEESSTGA